jgi:hypothetical protein
VTTQVVAYQLDDGTTARFEVEPLPGFRPAGSGEIAGRVREAVGPAVEAAKTVLEKVKEAQPDEVELKFGIKVSGGANWLVAKAVGEASFEVTLTWRHEAKDTAAPDDSGGTVDPDGGTVSSEGGTVDPDGGTVGSEGGTVGLEGGTVDPGGGAG